MNYQINNTINDKIDLEDLELVFENNVIKKDGIYSINVNKKLGEGKVICIYLNNGLTCLNFDIILEKDTLITIDNEKNKTYTFLYCLQGDCYHKFDENYLLTKIEPLQSDFICSNKNIISKILVKKGEKLSLNIIKINKEEHSKKFNLKVKKIIDEHNLDRKIIHLGAFNLKIGELVKQIQQLENKYEICFSLYFKGISHLILANHIQLLFVESENKGNTTSLSKTELKKIHKLCNFIKDNPEVQHSIRTLCLHSSLSPVKLQVGFKLVGNRTVSDFIRNIRIEKAEYLIRMTDLNISEIVYTIGLTSRSYFCKIFKNKYHCSPKKYKIKVRVLNEH